MYVCKYVKKVRLCLKIEGQLEQKWTYRQQKQRVHKQETQEEINNEQEKKLQRLQKTIKRVVMLSILGLLSSFPQCYLSDTY